MKLELVLGQTSTKATLLTSNYILELYHEVVNSLNLVTMSLDRTNYIHDIMKFIGMINDKVNI